MSITVRERVGEDELGPGGEWLLDEVYLLGAIEHRGDLHFATQLELEELIAKTSAGDPILTNRAKINEGAQPLLIVHGDLSCAEPLTIQGFSLVVLGSLTAPGIYLGPVYHLSIAGDLDAKAIVVWGADGANIWCAGAARVGCFAHDQNGHQIEFVEPPVECRINEKLRRENQGLEALIAAIESGTDPLAAIE